MATRKATKKTKPSTSATSVSSPVSAENSANFAFPIVGLGASAGGLEAYEQFFRHMPPASGLAFVVVQHLDPGHGSMLTDILQRCTTMPVVEAEDQLAVAPDHVYVIPPNRDMAIFEGVLQVSMPDEPRGRRMPVDVFLRSLAEDRGERAVGIILSGMGTDGTQGLRAILGAGGVTLVQEPTTAKYDGMPTSAIKSGFATHILSAEKMPEALLASARKQTRHHDSAVAPAQTAMPPGGMKRVLMLLRSVTGQDFSHYKKSTIGRRIERRMAQHDLSDIDVYARYLKEHREEVQALFKELLINVTSFFRDPEAFTVLKQDILPQLCADKPDDYVFRVWVAGCATGEEAYSIAILLREVMDETRKEFNVQLYSTDLDEDAIAIARSGLYPPNIAADVTPERLRRFFAKEDDGYRIKKEIREMVVFAIQNVIKDPPFTRLDLLSCRNLMIYLEPGLQDRLIPAFHYALKPGGALFLSSSESIGSHADLFTPLSRKWKFYRSIPTIARPVAARDLSWTAETGDKGRGEAAKIMKETDVAELTRRALLESYAPASVVTDAKGDILHVHGDTGKYLRPAPGQPSLNVVDMAREGLQLELRAALHAAVNQGAATLGQEVSVKTNGDRQRVSISVRPLHDPNGNQGLLVSFQDVALPPSAKRPRNRPIGAVDAGRIGELERDLAYTRENLQATIEEQQASAEELKSANEEMQSTNEELQSTNEELETSREELQSVNEELMTVNSELQAKIEQLTDVENDLKNLLDNINIGTVFLDRHLTIRRFTRDATRIYRLVTSDVGRPLADIKSNLEDDDLTGVAETVLGSLVSCEREVRIAGGASYLARIQPYRTLDNVIDGVVLTFTDISKRVKAEAAEHEARQLAEEIIDTVSEPLMVLDGDMTVISASGAFYRRFGATHEETIGKPIYDLGNRQWDIPALHDLLENVLPQQRSFDGFAVELDIPAIGRCKMVLNARRIVVKAGARPLILLAMEEGPAT
jgi:two-component system CheB/CheR fusion protein